MFNKLKNLFSGGASGHVASGIPQAGDFAPAEPLYVVGDVHGCFDLLNAALERIEAHAGAHNITSSKLVLLGDYVDRGPQSAQVLECIYTLQQNAPDRVICLMGNHEKMMLEFIDDPVGRGARWLKFGGADTLASYGIPALKKKADVEDITEASMALEEAMPKGLQDWVRALPLSFQNGNIACVHAAMDPDDAPDAQSDRVMLWGHRDFMTVSRDDNIWVAHGHTIVKSPSCQNSRIALDTGAYQSGHLSVAALSSGQCEFL